MVSLDNWIGFDPKKSSIPQSLMNHFTPEQIGEYREAFNLFDLDQDGAISEPELGQVMESLNQKMTSAELKEFIDEVDIDGNGTIEFNEFLEMLVKKLPEGEVEEDDVTIAFKVFDRDGNGFVTKAELRHVLTNLGESLTDDEIDEIIDEADKDKDGQLSFKEFRELFEEVCPTSVA